ncbi:MAG: hypothetical protein WCK84_14460 [Bacteroidota bacterium]
MIINDTPFKTDKFLRIPYTLKTWEWKKSGLSLRQINVLDDIFLSNSLFRLIRPHRQGYLTGLYSETRSEIRM